MHGYVLITKPDLIEVNRIRKTYYRGPEEIVEALKGYLNITADPTTFVQVEKIGLEYTDVEGLKKLSKNKKPAKKSHDFLASEAVIKQIPRLLGPGLNKAGKANPPKSKPSSLRSFFLASSSSATLPLHHQ
ncbi:hypothetical protein RHGRI_004929 [Rhododendron griersonianum]|uniref:Uncharacterized protein n=1 Tax=Rhododendron griersonianum TaxID=479676 RepID=A0AAV6LDQ2_9ERIC|nr:hypothetical protein RHGRI_004929 [Rhododendron griersonianum]